MDMCKVCGEISICSSSEHSLNPAELGCGLFFVIVAYCKATKTTLKKGDNKLKRKYYAVIIWLIQNKSVILHP